MTNQNHRRRKWLLLPLLFFFLFTTGSLAVNFLSMFLEPFDSELNEFCSDAGDKQRDSIDIYIPGAGFSGFYYTLGRLEALHNHSKISSRSPSYEYYCFSAGCLALVTSLLNISIDSILKLAQGSRNRWFTGEISRYDVVENFVDGLLSNIEKIQHIAADDYLGLAQNENANATTGGRPVECDNMEHMQCAFQNNIPDAQDFLSRIHVITSEWSAERLLSQNIQTPSSVQHLRQLLIETTWIPFVTGASFGYFDDDTGSHHNDGAFAGLFQNFVSQTKSEIRFEPCRHHYSLLLPWSFDLLSNGLNYYLSYDRAVQFWREGLWRGVK